MSSRVTHLSNRVPEKQTGTDLSHGLHIRSCHRLEKLSIEACGKSDSGGTELLLKDSHQIGASFTILKHWRDRD